LLEKISFEIRKNCTGEPPCILGKGVKTLGLNAINELEYKKTKDDCKLKDRFQNQGCPIY
jgi:hypothetical protein